MCAFLLALSNVRNVAIHRGRTPLDVRLDRKPHCHSRTDRSHSRDTAKTFRFSPSSPRTIAFLHRSRHCRQISTQQDLQAPKQRKTKSTSSVLNLVFLGPHLQITGGDDACEGSQQPFGFWLQNRELTSSGPGTSLSCRCRSTSCPPRAWAAPHKTPLHNSKSASGSAQESLACNALLHSFKSHVLH